MIVSDAVSWRVFLRALALELEQQAGADAAVTLLRGAGAQMGRMRSLPPVGSLEALAQEMNAVLGEMGWGRASLALDESAPCVVLTHTGLPQIGSAGDPPAVGWYRCSRDYSRPGWDSSPGLIRHSVQN